jgi:hypothetical protein
MKIYLFAAHPKPNSCWPKPYTPFWRQNANYLILSRRIFLASHSHTLWHHELLKLKNMKRTFVTFALTAALLLTIGVGSSFARGTTNGNDNANAYFHRDFQQAELLDIRTGTDYTRFTFRLDGAILTAYYSNSGEQLAITHNITSNQLPLSLLMQVKKDYANYWISDLFELNRNGESEYYITLESADKKITLRSGDYNWEVFSKSTKE